jgi:hypothetical protein
VKTNETKDLAPARGGDAPNRAPAGGAQHRTGDPCSPSYYAWLAMLPECTGRLRVLLEAGDLEAAISDFFAGTLTAPYGIALLDEARAYLAHPRAWATS